MATPPEPLDRLRHAPVELLGRIVESSNATFLVSVGECSDATAEPVDGDTDPRVDMGAEVRAGRPEDGWGDNDDEADPPDADADGDEEPTLPEGLKAVYKPLQGERPLWDFPEGLYRREVAAYELSRALGWDLIPGTVDRDDVLGVGSLQRFVEADFSRHYFVLRDEGRHDDQLLRMGVFDLLVNNTDRKGGHVLVDDADHIWGIDNALCFSTEARLRTVIWDFAGEAIPDELMDAVVALVDEGLPDSVTDHLLDEEADRLLRRARVVRSGAQMPHDPTGRQIPWPLL
ncbi:hypothetical protein BH24ACT4_BH24ACT4_13700 [soil metagenome]